MMKTVVTFAILAAFSLTLPSNLAAQQPVAPVGALPLPPPGAPPAPPLAAPVPVPAPPSAGNRRASANYRQDDARASASYPTPSSSSAVSPLIIQFAAPEAGAESSVGEDLAIMTRVLEKSLDRVGEIPLISKLGIRFFLTGDSRSVRAAYIEGFGALFMIKVNFPVRGPATVSPNKTAEPRTDSEWENAKREIVSGGKRDPEFLLESGADYDPNLVLGVTDSLVAALKNASHIRGLKPDEYVAITVFGSASPTAGERDRSGVLSLPGSGLVSSTGGAPRASIELTNRSSGLRQTVLSIRAKKSDIDAFAAGGITPEVFRSRATVYSYAGVGHGMTSLNSWVHN